MVPTVADLCRLIIGVSRRVFNQEGGWKGSGEEAGVEVGGVVRGGGDERG